jgi:hypothetical protein
MHLLLHRALNEHLALSVKAALSGSDLRSPEIQINISYCEGMKDGYNERTPLRFQGPFSRLKEP